ncbi:MULTISPECIES: penicillin acylase family protein [Streptomycetaceae]|uniref:Putative penicillin acylase n=1 Tax=Streptantibioticus cattleyicolor (strain ATCC 35852 / DSM 46488 / JCM 4925 / NBRC 14057 / NRRL 8057) TaxID=1003195 RepID=F8JX84_STREN|nr:MULTISPECIES: penicillin acylase family protein [Streptomycetaceae]AEW94549.1 putative penicillin acylase [Streptantibioticus cattleyicolor NRRL 8057 = DSM 46488]MYS59189.1 penicillin acylase family protein [Streptomyces sp. SID5468]CCB74908.1 putative penicillin acylase [Streptantibioticus cattleyicolor NRRL 8057 = DSM 46488]
MPANPSGPPAKKKGRRARLVVILVVLLLVAGIGYGSYWSVSTVRASFPVTTGTLKLNGLTAPVQVKRDDHGIPQIYADDAADLFRAQGYVQAQDRFWEMDVRRHLTAGRLSEMFGSGQVENDAFIRTLGWRRVAQQEWDTQLSPTAKAYLRAYSDGVNAYLSGHHGSALSVEYAVLGLTHSYTPERWTPVDSISWLKAMAWDLRSNIKDEIDRALMTSRLTPAQIAQLYPEYPYGRNRPITGGGSVTPDGSEYVPAGRTATGGGQTTSQRYPNAQLSALSRTIDQLPALLGPSGNGIGSNSWVVSGTYTTTGKPMLANDPHLAPQMPSLWYQMGLHCRTVNAACPYDVSGYTFSGMPGVVIGHNQDIAWGMTNMGADVTDLYLEKVTADSYLYDGKQVPFRTRQETIKVAGGSSRVITVRETRDGMPLISDRSDEMAEVGQNAPVGQTAPDRRDGYAVALRWTALTPGKTMEAVFELDRATDFTHFRKAAQDFAVPAQNLVYADTRNNIGYQAPGMIPVRHKVTGGIPDDGRYPVPGWDPDYRWTGYIPAAALPWEYNPKRGYIVTANQAVTDKKYPYLLTDDWGYGTRSQRINDLIASKIAGGGKISMDDMQSMQMDDSSEIAKLLVPYLLKVDISDPYVRQAQQLLEGWDFNQDGDSAAAAYFNAVWRNVLKLAFGNKLPKEVRPKGQCLRVPPAGGSGPVDDLGTPKLVTECGQRDPAEAQPDGGDRWFEVVRAILPDATNPWWNTSTTGAKNGTDRDQLLAKAMKDARWELTSKLGKDINTWSWGRLHKMTLRNQTLGTQGPAIVKWLLNRGPWQLGGGEAAVNATGWNAAAGYDVVWVPSMRMIVSLDDFDKSRWINLTGASGHAYDAHYSDQTAMWVDGQLLPWAYSGGAVDKAAQDKLTLTP